jgi:hypothetical protein
VSFAIGNEDDTAEHHVDACGKEGGCDEKKDNLERVYGDRPIWALLGGDDSLHSVRLISTIQTIALRTYADVSDDLAYAIVVSPSETREECGEENIQTPPRTNGINIQVRVHSI